MKWDSQSQSKVAWCLCYSGASYELEKLSSIEDRGQTDRGSTKMRDMKMRHNIAWLEIARQAAMESQTNVLERWKS